MYNIDRPAWQGYANTITFNHVNFENIKARTQAGAFYINNKYITNWSFSNCNFLNI